MVSSGKNKIKAVSFVSLVLSCDMLSASGFAIIDQSVSSMGTAYSGISVQAEDATTIFFNPAGMSKLEGRSISAGMHLIMPNVHFNSSSGKASGGNAGSLAMVPDFYFVTPINHKMKFGFAINSPFGLGVEYDDGWEGRYHALKSNMLTVNLNPAISYAFNDQISVAVGFNAQYVQLKLTNAIDFGTVCQHALSVAACNAAGITPQNLDGHFKGKGDDWGFGFNVGVLYEPILGTRIGIAYRSKIEYTLQGDAKFKVPTSAAFLALSGAFANTGVEGDLTVPETLSIGLFQQLNKQWEVMADLTWTRWERFKQLAMHFDNPQQPDEVQQEQWKNTFRYSLGFNYKPTVDWLFRLGVAYDEAPITSAGLRTPRIPDANRYWFSIGTGYKLNAALSVDIAYIHLFIQDAEMNATTSLGHSLKGRYKEDDNTLGAQLNWKF